MFSNGILIPSALLKKLCIGCAELAGLAVNTNTSRSPFASTNFLASWANGPFWPSTTLENSEKSNSAPASCSCSD